MIAAEVPLAERNRCGRWAPECRTVGTVYNRPEPVGGDDPLSKVPIGGHRTGMGSEEEEERDQAA